MRKNDSPQLMSHDGHLKFQAADGKNITFTNINGDILFNGLSIRNLLSVSSFENFQYFLQYKFFILIDKDSLNEYRNNNDFYIIISS